MSEHDAAKARRHSYLISVAHGTYGHNDDSYGALLVANGILARGWEADMLLREDGVYMALKGQDPNDIGLDNNLKHMADLVELGGTIYVLGPSLKERGLERDELIDGIEIIGPEDLLRIVDRHDFCLTF